MSTDSGSGFDNQAAGRDAGDERLAKEESRHQLGEDAGDGVLEEESRHQPGEDAGEGVLEEARERRQAEEKLNEAF
jgi:hypothetical protein